MTKTLDPKTRILIDMMASVQQKPLAETTPEEFRAMRQGGRDVINLPAPDLAMVQNVTVKGAAGDRKARIYDVEAGAERPTLIYYHGGGFVFGDLESHDPLCRRLAHEGAMRVIAIDYRLAPEAPFPAPVDDAIAAAIHIFRNPEAYGVDPDRLAVGGDSAGGNLAINVARHAALTGDLDVAFQLLIYPVTQQGRSTPSRETYAEGYFLTKEGMDWFHGHYIPPGTDKNDPRLSPLYAPVPAGSAAAYVITAGFDPLLDEGRMYAEHLSAAAVPTRYVDYPSQIHGFVSFTAFSEVAADAIRDCALAVKEGLG